MHHSDMVTALLRAQKVPLPLTEQRFHSTRRWRFDYAWIEYRVALEVEGGVWIGGRHTTGAGFVKDMEKYNEAACMGWRIIRCQPKQLCKIETIDTIRRALEWQ
jgi:hypothetical protein